MWKRRIAAGAALAGGVLMVAGCATDMAGPADPVPEGRPAAMIVFDQGEPVGMTGFKWTNELSYSAEGYDQVRWLRSPSPLKADERYTPRPNPEMSVRVEANRRGYFKVEAANWSASCSDYFSFIPEAGNTYRIRATLSDDRSCGTTVIEYGTETAPTTLEVGR